MREVIEAPVPSLANAGPNCDPCGGPLNVIVQGRKGLTFSYSNVSRDEKLQKLLIIKLARQLCVVSHYVVLKITNAQIPHERGPQCITSVLSA
jgi:hypothetical protein